MRFQTLKNRPNLHAKVEGFHRDNQINANLTMIIANIGATNPHIAPSSVSIQQLYNVCITMTRYISN